MSGATHLRYITRQAPEEFTSEITGGTVLVNTALTGFWVFDDRAIRTKVQHIVREFSQRMDANVRQKWQQLLTASRAKQQTRLDTQPWADRAQEPPPSVYATAGWPESARQALRVLAGVNDRTQLCEFVHRITADVLGNTGSRKTGVWQDHWGMEPNEGEYTPWDRFDIGKGGGARHGELIEALWRDGLVLYPAAFAVNNLLDLSPQMPRDEMLPESVLACVALTRRRRVESKNEGASRRGAMWTTVLGVLRATTSRDVLDIDKAILSAVFREHWALETEHEGGRKWTTSNREALRDWHLLQMIRAAEIGRTDEYRAKIETQGQYKAVLKPNLEVRSDPTFRWAVGDERTAEWAEALRTYVAETPLAGVPALVAALNPLLDYVMANPDVPSSPIGFCARSFEPNVRYSDFAWRGAAKETTVGPNTAATRVQMAHDFLAWCLGREELDDSLVYRLPPDIATGLEYRGSKGKTTRRAIPLLVQALIEEILDECWPHPDRAPGGTGTSLVHADERAVPWARALKADYFGWHNPATGKVEEVWSPARALLWRLRLIIPMRALSARLLDSGEADSRVFRNHRWETADLTSALRKAAPRTRPDQGFIREYTQSDGLRTALGFYLTSDKGDVASHFEDLGHEIPWSDPTTLALHQYMLTFQERYNPVHELKRRADLHGEKISDAVARKLHGHTFLFRDAASARPKEPPTSSRLYAFWLDLLTEAEHRLWQQGVHNDDGTRVALLIRGESGALRPRWDGHSLRVTLITRLLEFGVPLQVVSRFIVGHASIVTTLHYDVGDIDTITDVMDSAKTQIRERQRDHTLDWIRDLKRSDNPDGFVAVNDPAATKLLHDQQSGLKTDLEYGICPVGGQSCGEGGPKVGNRHGPTPGGDRNCARCRFFVTGPPFLTALVAKINEVGGDAERLRARMEELKGPALTRAYQVAKSDPEWQGQPLLHPRVRQLREQIESNDTMLAEALINQEAWKRLTVASIVALRAWKLATAASEDGGPLVPLVSGSKYALRMRHDAEAPQAELWNRICEDSIIFQCIDAGVAATERGKVLDQVLANGGMHPTFYQLSRQDSIDAGNAMWRFMQTRLGTAQARKVVTLEANLNELGITEEEIRSALTGICSSAAGALSTGVSAQRLALASPTEAAD